MIKIKLIPLALNELLDCAVRKRTLFQAFTLLTGNLKFSEVLRPQLRGEHSEGYSGQVREDEGKKSCDPEHECLLSTRVDDGKILLRSGTASDKEEYSLSVGARTQSLDAQIICRAFRQRGEINL